MIDFIFIIKTTDIVHWSLSTLRWGLGLVMSGGWKMTLKLRMLLRRGAGRRRVLIPDMSELDWTPHSPQTTSIL